MCTRAAELNASLCLASERVRRSPDDKCYSRLCLDDLAAALVQLANEAAYSSHGTNMRAQHNG
jgi:hypothetical protein